MKSDRCIECGGQLAATTITDEVKVGTVTLRITNVPARQCPDCGETLIAMPIALQAERKAAGWLARSNVSEAAALKFMRKSIPIKAVDMAALLGVSSGTLSKWETGDREIEPAALSLLQRLVIESERGETTMLEQLRASSLERSKKKRKRLSGSVSYEACP